MSRSLGLREDQWLGELLVKRIAGLFPMDPERGLREQARSQRDHTINGGRACWRKSRDIQ
ncbi:hypothetical protein DOCECA_24765 [Pseudomonas sp. E102]